MGRSRSRRRSRSVLPRDTRRGREGSLRRHSRGSRRSRSRPAPSRHSGSCRTSSPTRRSSGCFEDAWALEANWQTDASMLDSRAVYNYTLPRRVVTNAYTRGQGIADRPLQELRLIEFLHGKQANWALRPIAHGKPAFFEMFRSRGDAIFASQLLRAIKDNPRLISTRFLFSSMVGLWSCQTGRPDRFLPRPSLTSLWHTCRV